eukprot:4897635-Lingulodinium_polyedra.AAC.1
MVAPYNPDDAETWIPQTFSSPVTMAPSDPELEAPSPVDASRMAQQQVPDIDDDNELLCYNN